MRFGICIVNMFITEIFSQFSHMHKQIYADVCVVCRGSALYCELLTDVIIITRPRMLLDQFVTSYKISKVSCF